MKSYNIDFEQVCRKGRCQENESLLDCARRLGIGICGSGVIDPVAQLYLAGVLDDSGRLTGSHTRIRTANKQVEFLLVNKESRGRQPWKVLAQS